MNRQPTTEMPINFKNVNAGYRGNNTLRDITLSIEPGSIVGISGPNGSGKTTLLRVIQGLLPVSSGSAEVLGMTLGARNLKKIRLAIACVFQNLNTDPRMPVTAEEVVMMGRYGKLGLLRHPGEVDRRAVQDALERVEAVHLARRPFGQLSGGEQQRINLARALAQEPELLLLDEPTTFLDSDSQQRVRDIVRATHKEMGTTTLVVSHDFEMLSDLCERIVVMKAGRICEGVGCV